MATRKPPPAATPSTGPTSRTGQAGHDAWAARAPTSCGHVPGLFILILFVVLGLFGSQLAPYPADELSVGTPLDGPSAAHPFGLNQNGQDMLSRVMAGAHVSFIISFWAVFLGAGLSSLGILGGYFGRWLDYLVQRSGEAFAAFPKPGLVPHASHGFRAHP